MSVTGDLIFSDPMPDEAASGISGRITGTRMVGGASVGIDGRDAGFLRGQTVMSAGIPDTFQSR